MNFSTWLTALQVGVAVILVLLILIQERGAGAGGLFGGVGSEFYQRRRGLERLVFLATIFSLIIFAGLSIVNLIVR